MPTLFHNPNEAPCERWLIDLLASLGLEAERIPRFGETCDEISANLAPHSREMRVLILETLLRVESGDLP